eukprot:m.15354 g.15354  ORF g.15354 m.15354 type:complete len:356 (-) comp7839_c0_seq1:32-1099(-)
MSGKKHGDFMEKPKEGWVHDTTALSAPGLFYSYPAIYLGSINVAKSMRFLRPMEQSTVTRDMIRIVATAANARPKTPRWSHAALNEYLDGQVTDVDADVNLNISAKGFMIVPVELQEDGDVKEVGMLEFSDMRLISLAAGGENEDFDLVCYIAKNEFGLRECYVFDCGSHSQEVLETMGQAFSIVNGQEQPKPPEPTKDKFNPYDNLNSFREKKKHELMANAAYDGADAAEDNPEGYFSVGQVYEDIGFSNPLYDHANVGEAVVSQYDHVDSLPGLSPEDLEVEDKEAVIRKLNNVDKVRRCVREQDGQYFDISMGDEDKTKPQWNYFDISANPKEKVPVDRVKASKSVRKTWKQ